MKLVYRRLCFQLTWVQSSSDSTIAYRQVLTIIREFWSAKILIARNQLNNVKEQSSFELYVYSSRNWSKYQNSRISCCDLSQTTSQHEILLLQNLPPAADENVGNLGTILHNVLVSKAKTEQHGSLLLPAMNIFTRSMFQG